MLSFRPSRSFSQSLNRNILECKYRCNFKFNVEKWKVRSLIKGKIKSEDDCYYLLELIEDCYSWSQAKEVIEEVLS